MNLPGSILMIEGDHLSNLNEVFNYFDYDVISGDEIVTSWQIALDNLSNWVINPTRVKKVACILQGWTIILDPELVMYEDQEICAEISRDLQARVFGLIYQDETSTYGFSFYHNKRIRRLTTIAGEIVEDYGEPLQEEVQLNIDVDASTYVFEVMAEVGVYYHRLKYVNSFIIFELEFREDGTSSPDSHIQNPPQDENREWWF